MSGHDKLHVATLDMTTMRCTSDSRPMTDAEKLAMYERRARENPGAMRMAEQNVQRSEAGLDMLLSAMLRSVAVHRLGLVTETMMARIRTDVRGVMMRATGLDDHPALRIALDGDSLDIGLRFADTDSGRMQRYELGIAVYETLVSGLEGR